MWPKLKKLVVLGRELGFFLKTRCTISAEKNKVYYLGSYAQLQSLLD